MNWMDQVSSELSFPIQFMFFVHVHILFFSFDDCVIIHIFSFRWVDDTPVDYINWDQGGPDGTGRCTTFSVQYCKCTTYMKIQINNISP